MSNNILIGICELESINENKITWNINKLGGNPDWMHTNVEINCKFCGKLLFLICQLYCPLQSSELHRILYLFSCIDQSCWNNSKAWIVLRCNTYSKSVANESKNIVKSSAFDEFKFDDLEWSEDFNDYSYFDAQIVQNDPVSKEMDNLKLNDTNLLNSACKLPIKINSNKLAFKSYYINVFNEDDIYSTEYDDLSHANELLQKYLQIEGISFSDLEKQHDLHLYPDEGNERSVNNKVNKNLIKYQKAIFKCPNQVIRYHYGGEELLVNECKPNIPNCKCGSKRHFEFQLMPSIVKFLHFNDSTTIKDKQLEFTSVLVYTCSRNCGTDDDASNQHYRNEYIYLEIEDIALHNFNLK